MKLPAAQDGSAGQLAIFTVCSNNHIGLARNFLKKMQRHHPEAQLFLCIGDEPCNQPGFYPDGCTLVFARDLGIAEFDNFAFRYDVFELNTALKPYMFLRLLDQGFSAVLYFDTDIEIYSRLDQVLQRLANGVSLLLTPHLTAPAEDSAFVDDVTIMKAGTYNLGFLGVSNCEETQSIIQWWARRLAYLCISAQHQGLFVDQKFMDLVPGFAKNAFVLRDHTLNAGYWNLSQRTLTRESFGWAIDGEPLGFFHFSGFDFNNTQCLSRYTASFRDNAISPELAQLIADYAQDLSIQGHGDANLPEYAFGRFASGTKIPIKVRELFRTRHGTWPTNPFETYEDYVNAPWWGQWYRGTEGIITNVMGYLHETDPWLKAAFNLQTPEGVRGYLQWWNSIEDPEFAGNLLKAGKPVLPTIRVLNPISTPPESSIEEPENGVNGRAGSLMEVSKPSVTFMRTFPHSDHVGKGLAKKPNSSLLEEGRAPPETLQTGWQPEISRLSHEDLLLTRANEKLKSANEQMRLEIVGLGQLVSQPAPSATPSRDADGTLKSVGKKIGREVRRVRNQIFGAKST